PHSVSVRLRHEDGAGRVDDDPRRKVERRLGRKAAVAARARFAGTGDGRNRARSGVDEADAVVVRIGNVETAIRVDGYSHWIAENSVRRRASVAPESQFADTDHRRDEPGLGLDAANDAVIRVGDIEVSRTVDGRRDGEIERRSGSGAPVAGIAKSAIP